MVRTIFVATVLVVFAVAPALTQLQQPAPEGMILIQAGEFMMGSPPGEGRNDEHPQHKVYVDAFYMDKHEVTNAQYKKFVDATGHREPFGPEPWAQFYNWRNGTYPEDLSNHPVVLVSWEDATAYAKWAGKRLPTEAEWEYACQAGSTGKYCFGNDQKQLGDYAWYGDNSGGKTHPVGLKKPNVYGLYDMHGNVWEWCSDWYDENYYEKTPSSNPKGPTSGQFRVLRGGSWRLLSGDTRAAFRIESLPDFRYHVIGFRCAGDV